MFCKNCGKEIDDHAEICPYCGVRQAPAYAPQTKQPTCTLAVVGFVLSFFFSIPALICSIIARKKCREENLEGGGFALAGIIISAISLAISLILIISLVGMTTCIASTVPAYYR